MDTNNLKPCPFCGSTKLDISCKTATSALVNGRIYRTSVYCRSCNTYGPRATVRDPEDCSYKFSTKDAEAEAIRLWNNRK